LHSWGRGLGFTCHMIHTRGVCFHYLKLNRLIYIYETHLFPENLAQEDFNNPSR
jgi:hypothetical protein